MTDIAAAWNFVRTRGLHIGLEILVNVVAPFTVYHFTESRIGEVDALLASMLVPLLWSLVEFIRRRRIDTLSVLVLGSIALSLLAFIGTGSARVLQLRENFVTGLIGLVFLGSAVIRQPLIYLLARAMMQRQSTPDLEAAEGLEDDEQVRRGLMTITIVWGLGLIAQAALASALVFSVSVSSYLLISPFVSYGTIGVLVLWTLWFSQNRG